MILKRLVVGLAGTVAVIAIVIPGIQVWLTDFGKLPDPPANTLRVASYNVHYIRAGEEDGPWSLADWEARKTSLDASVKATGADLIAFQEMESFTRGSDGSLNLARDYLSRENPGYALAATGDWRAFPSTQPIFFRPDVLELRDEGWFFFSDTPDRIYSPTFNGSWPAFASWAEFAPLGGGAPFRVVNVHFDSGSGTNRRLSAELVAERLEPIIEAETPVILLGDLNTFGPTRPMRVLEGAGLRFPGVPGATFHMDLGLHLLPAIDRIGVSEGIAVEGGPYVLQDSFEGEWGSDHHPLIADLLISAE